MNAINLVFCQAVGGFFPVGDDNECQYCYTEHPEKYEDGDSNRYVAMPKDEYESFIRIADLCAFLSTGATPESVDRMVKKAQILDESIDDDSDFWHGMGVDEYFLERYVKNVKQRLADGGGERCHDCMLLESKCNCDELRSELKKRNLAAEEIEEIVYRKQRLAEDE